MVNTAGCSHFQFLFWVWKVVEVLLLGGFLPVDGGGGNGILSRFNCKEGLPSEESEKEKKTEVELDLIRDEGVSSCILFVS